MTTLPSNKIKYLLATKAIDFANDTFQIILMDSGYVFNPDTHEKYADISANELANGNGYTTGGETLANVSVVENDSDDRCDVTWDDVTWTASGGPVGPTPGAIIYDDTEANNAIVGYIDFGSEQTQADGGTATITNISIRIS